MWPKDGASQVIGNLPSANVVGSISGVVEKNKKKLTLHLVERT